MNSLSEMMLVYLKKSLWVSIAVNNTLLLFAFHISVKYDEFIVASSLNGQKDSIYSLALNSIGTVLISGSTEKVQ